MKIWNCRLNNPHHNQGVVIFEDCEIATLSLENNAKVIIKNSKIGTLSIQQVNLIDMERGCVLNIETAAPGEGNPLTGSIDFVNTFLPRTRKDYLLHGPQPYRNMRHHLRNIENGQMANLFHSLELAIERERDTKMNRLLSHAYELFSDFGASATRPIVGWFLTGFIVAAILFFCGGATQALSDEYYSGWRESFITTNSYDVKIEAFKSLYLSFNSMLNPLGLFGYRTLLTPANGWLFILLLLQGLLSATLIALMILAIRRRFKMQ